MVKLKMKIKIGFRTKNFIFIYTINKIIYVFFIIFDFQRFRFLEFRIKDLIICLEY